MIATPSVMRPILLILLMLLSCQSVPADWTLPLPEPRGEWGERSHHQIATERSLAGKEPRRS